MKRTLLGVLALVVLAVAVWVLRRGPQGTPPSAAVAPGQYVNDSLGVGMLLPETPGWVFRQGADVPGGGVVMALYADSTAARGQQASVRVYAHPKTAGASLQDIAQQRREQLAHVFGVENLDEVIEKVIKNEEVDFGGRPAWQWQGVTENVAVAGEEPKRVMFMLLTLEREQNIFEVVGILAYPARPTPADQQTAQALSQDVNFILQSFQVR